MLFNTVLSLASLAVAAALQVNTPSSLTVCQPAALSFTGGTAPYFMSIIPAGNPSAAPLKQFDQAQSSPITWNVDLPAGTNVSIALTDASGQPVYSSDRVIIAGSSTSCLNGTSASGSASGSATASNSASNSASASAGAASGSARPSGAAIKNSVLSAGFLGLLGVAVGVAA